MVTLRPTAFLHVFLSTGLILCRPSHSILHLFSLVLYSLINLVKFTVPSASYFVQVGCIKFFFKPGELVVYGVTQNLLL
jgi:hypothetical protein